MRINTNINSMRTQEYMRQNQAKMSNSMDRLSSGKRINNASDDAAGLAIATRMRARESGLGVASNNTQDGISLIRTADSAMNSVSNILLRMRDLANQSANGTNTDDNKAALQKEFAELQKQITYIADNTQFNDKNLLKDDSTIKIQTLDSKDSDQQIGIDLKSTSLSALGIEKLTIGSSANPLAKATIEAKDAYDSAKVLSDAARTDIEDKAGATSPNTDAQKALAYIEAKEALAQIKPGEDGYEGAADEVAAKAKELTNDAKGLVDAYETKLAATTAKKAEYDDAKIASNADTAVAKKLVTAYEDAKSAITSPDTETEGTKAAKSYIDAKAALEKNPKSPEAKTQFEEAKASMEKNADAKALVATYESAKTAATNGTPLNAIENIDAALKKVADNRATLGATLNRLDFNVNNLKSQQSSMASAASQVEDADMAKEMSEMTKFKILNEAGISMLSQANQTPQMVSKLLQ
ncbi:MULTISPECIES: flagellin [Bacillus]|uniref:Flagellin n=1 Tax=Bacillus cereus TaxID=1396 RepID=A0A2A8J2Y6_BACCE|nr:MULTISPECIES: flagellin [Bacillus]MDH4420948.1 flagellin [Bacillus cereus]PER26584.1 flagellin [Bacillus cereus]PGT98723.1 flagellin [Bacillus cereus]PGZ71531.1 flagellin [Bacillus sp. AFS029637]